MSTQTLPDGFRLLSRDEFDTLADVGTQLVWDAEEQLMARMKVLSYNHNAGWLVTTTSSVPTGYRVRLDYRRFFPVALIDDQDFAALLAVSLSQETAKHVMDDEAERRRAVFERRAQIRLVPDNDLVY